MRYFAVSLLIVSLAFSETVAQSNWSGGPGIQGPVTEWGTSFWFSDSTIDYSSVYPQLNLAPQEHALSGHYWGPTSLHSNDFNGDGVADVLGTGLTDISWWENSDTAPGLFWIKHTIAEGFNNGSFAYSIDIDGDGDVDALGASHSGDVIAWWENTDGAGTAWTQHTVDGSYDGARSVASVDIDGDGDADILGAADFIDDITWWENTDGAGTVWTEHTVDGEYDGAGHVSYADFNGDGHMDVLASSYYPGYVTWWENSDGTGTAWIEHTVASSFVTVFDVYSYDIDGDGDADILGAISGNYDAIVWWENTDGAGTAWGEHTVDGDFDGVRSVHATDIDGDGDEDVIGGSVPSSGGAIAWWENTDGIGSTWTEHMLDDDFWYVYSVYSADINADGDPEVLGAAEQSHEIVFWDLSPSGALYSSILDAENAFEWLMFTSSTVQPAGTAVGFQFRSSDDHTSMGEWSDTVYAATTSLEEILEDSTRYLQYKVILETSSPTLTPELQEVVFSYTSESAVEEGGSAEVESWSFRAMGNPCYGVLSFSLAVPEAGYVELSVYDISGRIVSAGSYELSRGTHELDFIGLKKGVYFCTVRAEEFTSAERVILLN